MKDKDEWKGALLVIIILLPIIAGSYSCAAIRYKECRTQFSWFYCMREFFK